MTSAKGRTVIGEALARVMCDAPLHVLHTLNHNGYTHADAMEIARRVVRELDHAGWRVKSGARRYVMELEDAVSMALSMSDCKRLASQSPQWSKEARDLAAASICTVLGWKKVTLVRRNRA